MKVIDADKFLAYLIFSKHIDGMTCGEVRKVIEMCKVDALDDIRAEIEHIGGDDEKAFCKNLNESYKQGLKDALKVIDKYKAESEG